MNRHLRKLLSLTLVLLMLTSSLNVSFATTLVNVTFFAGDYGILGIDTNGDPITQIVQEVNSYSVWGDVITVPDVVADAGYKHVGWQISQSVPTDWLDPNTGLFYDDVSITRDYQFTALYEDNNPPAQPDYNFFISGDDTYKVYINGFLGKASAYQSVDSDGNVVENIPPTPPSAIPIEGKPIDGATHSHHGNYSYMNKYLYGPGFKEDTFIAIKGADIDGQANIAAIKAMFKYDDATAADRYKGTDGDWWYYVLKDNETEPPSTNNKEWYKEDFEGTGWKKVDPDGAFLYDVPTGVDWYKGEWPNGDKDGQNIDNVYKWIWSEKYDVPTFNYIDTPVFFRNADPTPPQPDYNFFIVGDDYYEVYIDDVLAKDVDGKAIQGEDPYTASNYTELHQYVYDKTALTADTFIAIKGADIDGSHNIAAIKAMYRYDNTAIPENWKVTDGSWYYYVLNPGETEPPSINGKKWYEADFAGNGWKNVGDSGTALDAIPTGVDWYAGDWPNNGVPSNGKWIWSEHNTFSPTNNGKIDTPVFFRSTKPKSEQAYPFIIEKKWLNPDGSYVDPLYINAKSINVNLYKGKELVKGYNLQPKTTDPIYQVWQHREPKELFDLQSDYRIAEEPVPDDFVVTYHQDENGDNTTGLLKIDPAVETIKGTVYNTLNAANLFILKKMGDNVAAMRSVNVDIYNIDDADNPRFLFSKQIQLNNGTSGSTNVWLPVGHVYKVVEQATQANDVTYLIGGQNTNIVDLSNAKMNDKVKMKIVNDYYNFYIAGDDTYAVYVDGGDNGSPNFVPESPGYNSFNKVNKHYYADGFNQNTLVAIEGTDLHYQIAGVKAMYLNDKNSTINTAYSGTDDSWWYYVGEPNANGDYSLPPIDSNGKNWYDIGYQADGWQQVSVIPIKSRASTWVKEWPNGDNDNNGQEVFNWIWSENWGLQYDDGTPDFDRRVYLRNDNPTPPQPDYNFFISGDDTYKVWIDAIGSQAADFEAADPMADSNYNSLNQYYYSDGFGADTVVAIEGQDTKDNVAGLKAMYQLADGSYKATDGEWYYYVPLPGEVVQDDDGNFWYQKNYAMDNRWQLVTQVPRQVYSGPHYWNNDWPNKPNDGSYYDESYIWSPNWSDASNHGSHGDDGTNEFDTLVYFRNVKPTIEEHKFTIEKQWLNPDGSFVEPAFIENGNIDVYLLWLHLVDPVLDSYNIDSTTELPNDDGEPSKWSMTVNRSFDTQNVYHFYENAINAVMGDYVTTYDHQITQPNGTVVGYLVIEPNQDVKGIVYNTLKAAKVDIGKQFGPNATLLDRVTVDIYNIDNPNSPQKLFDKEIDIDDTTGTGQVTVWLPIGHMYRVVEKSGDYETTYQVEYPGWSGNPNDNTVDLSNAAVGDEVAMMITNNAPQSDYNFFISGDDTYKVYINGFLGKASAYQSVDSDGNVVENIPPTPPSAIPIEGKPIDGATHSHHGNYSYMNKYLYGPGFKEDTFIAIKGADIDGQANIAAIKAMFKYDDATAADRYKGTDGDWWYYVLKDNETEPPSTNNKEWYKEDFEGTGWKKVDPDGAFLDDVPTGVDWYKGEWPNGDKDGQNIDNVYKWIWSEKYDVPTFNYIDTPVFFRNADPTPPQPDYNFFIAADDTYAVYVDGGNSGLPNFEATAPEEESYGKVNSHFYQPGFDENTLVAIEGTDIANVIAGVKAMYLNDKNSTVNPAYSGTDGSWWYYVGEPDATGGYSLPPSDSTGKNWYDIGYQADGWQQVSTIPIADRASTWVKEWPNGDNDNVGEAFNWIWSENWSNGQSDGTPDFDKRVYLRNADPTPPQPDYNFFIVGDDYYEVYIGDKLAEDVNGDDIKGNDPYTSSNYTDLHQYLYADPTVTLDANTFIAIKGADINGQANIAAIKAMYKYTNTTTGAVEYNGTDGTWWYFANGNPLDPDNLPVPPQPDANGREWYMKDYQGTGWKQVDPDGTFLNDVPAGVNWYKDEWPNGDKDGQNIDNVYKWIWSKNYDVPTFNYIDTPVYLRNSRPDVPQYTLSYNGNSSTAGAMPDEMHAVGSVFNLTKNTYVRDGYTFNGWNTAADGSGTPYADEASFTMPANDMTLYAQWLEIPQYTVTFDGQGGSGATGPQTEYAGVHALTANNFTLANHSFVGWATTSGGIKVYDDQADYDFQSDATLYAVWQADNMYTVTFDGQGGSGATGPQTEYAGVHALTANNFTLANHSFVGWATTSGGIKVYDDQADYDFQSDATLYAVWQADNMYTVTFDGQGGSGVTGPQTEYAGIHALIANNFTLANHNFVGWATTSGGIKVYDDQADYDFQSDATLYAVWQKDGGGSTTFTVTYDPNGGTTTAADSNTYNAGDTVTVSTAGATRNGYTFLGWQYDGNMYNGNDTFTMPASNVTLVAQWQKDGGGSTTFTVTYDPNGGTTTAADSNTYNAGDTVTVSTAGATRNGYTFLGWQYDGNMYNGNDTFTMPASNVTLLAQWEAVGGNTVTINYVADTNGSVDNSSETIPAAGPAVGSTATPDSGYSFFNWTDESNLVVSNTAKYVPSKNTAGVYESATYTAHFRKNIIPGDRQTPAPNDYATIIFDNGSNGKLLEVSGYPIDGNGDLVLYVLKGISYGEVYKVLGDIIPNLGFKFAGWAPVLPADDVLVEADATYIAQYTTVGGSGTSSDDDDDDEFVITDPQIPLGQLDKLNHYAYIQGYPDGSVRPQDKITREEVAAIFFRLLEKDYREKIRSYVNTFSDVSKTSWSNKHISSLALGGILKGYQDGTFRPHNHITRAELAVIASRFDKLELNASHNFSDVSGHWAEPYIASAVKKGWINGYPDGTFKPEQTITRAEFATLVNNVLGRHVTVENVLPNARKFSDLAAGKWYYTAMAVATNSYLYESLPDFYQKWIEIIYPEIEM